jgi:hypothetical protein
MLYIGMAVIASGFMRNYLVALFITNLEKVLNSLMKVTNETIVKYQILDFRNIVNEIGYFFRVNNVSVDTDPNL